MPSGLWMAYWQQCVPSDWAVVVGNSSFWSPFTGKYNGSWSVTGMLHSVQLPGRFKQPGQLAIPPAHTRSSDELSDDCPGKVVTELHFPLFIFSCPKHRQSACVGRYMQHTGPKFQSWLKDGRKSKKPNKKKRWEKKELKLGMSSSKEKHLWVCAFGKPLLHTSTTTSMTE